MRFYKGLLCIDGCTMGTLYIAGVAKGFPLKHRLDNINNVGIPCLRINHHCSTMKLW